MLRIRKEHMEMLAQSAQADFHRRLITFLRAELPEETAGFADATLLE